MIEALDEEPPQGDFLTDTWLTRRRTWDAKAREIKLGALAREVYDQISGLLEGNDGGWVFETESSIDAVLYGYLRFHCVKWGDNALRETLVQKYPVIVRYLEFCETEFGNRELETRTQESGLGKLVRGWGVETGKRKKDLIGLGTLLGGVLLYTAYTFFRR
jgi:hypothetical protein